MGWGAPGRLGRIPTSPLSRAFSCNVCGNLATGVALVHHGALFGVVGLVSALGMDEEFECGPKMRLLTELQRKFVFVMVTTPGLPQWKYADMAGYAGGEPVCKVTACKLLQQKNINDAIHECAGLRLRSGALVAAETLMELAARSKSESIRVRASEALLDRVGLSGQQNINVQHTHTDRTGASLMERIRELAKKHGLDAEALLAGARPEVLTIEGKVDAEPV